VYRWVKTNWALLINATSLVGTTTVTSALGFAYWWLAARLFTPEAVGFGSAAVSAMILIGSISVLGLGTLLVGELPRQRGNELSLINAALIVVGGVGGCAGILFAAFASALATDFRALNANVANVLLFAAGVSLTAITLVLDQALIGLLRGGLQLWRNTLFAVIKLGVLMGTGLWLAQKTGLSIYATWSLGNALSLVALAGFAAYRWGRFKQARFKQICRPEWGLLRKLGPEALQHHVLNLTLQAPNLVLPLMVAVMLSVTMNAWFYVSWKIAAFIFVVPNALTTVLYAVNAAQPSALARKTRLTMGLAFLASAIAACLLLIDTRQVLDLFGRAYANEATLCLRILAFSSFPLVIKYHYIAISRIYGRMARALLPMVIGSVLELSMAALGARVGGLVGLSLGWVAAICCEALYMLPTVYKVLWPREAENLQQFIALQEGQRFAATLEDETGM
jgi:O-antigen/teichoic acid export membrane protein